MSKVSRGKKKKAREEALRKGLNKIQALKYMVQNGQYFDEWSGAGLWEEVSKMILSDKDCYTKDDLERRINRAKKF